jgi:hypothetical protein
MMRKDVTFVLRSMLVVVITMNLDLDVSIDILLDDEMRSFSELSEGRI